MDNVTGNKAVIAAGAHFKGQIKNARSIEINGKVEADLKADKVTIGPDGKFIGAINADLVVISGDYEGKMNAGSIWATATAKIAGEIRYKTLQMDRGAALNCRVVYNWKPEKPAAKSHVGRASKKNDERDANLNSVDGVDDKNMSQAPKQQGRGDKKNAVSEDTALKILAEPTADRASSKTSSSTGRRLGIFGFGAKPTTNTSGEKA